MTSAYQDHYVRALAPSASPNGEALPAQLLGELRDYFKIPASMSDDELLAKCRAATEDILVEWKSRKIDPRDTKAVTAFYVETNLYCYELLTLEIEASQGRQDQLKDFVGLLRKHGKTQGCDYGSGIGTLGIYLNRNGIHCDFADVSDTNLGFIRERLNRRGLQARTFNLTRESLPAGEYDFITAFDVLEHAADPVSLVGDIASRLKPGGLFIFNLLYDNEPDTPHVLMDPNPIRKNIRGFGLSKVESIGEFKIYRRVSRPRILNELVRGFDRGFWSLRERIDALKHAQAARRSTSV